MADWFNIPDNKIVTHFEIKKAVDQGVFSGNYNNTMPLFRAPKKGDFFAEYDSPTSYIGYNRTYPSFVSREYQQLLRKSDIHPVNRTRFNNRVVEVAADTQGNVYTGGLFTQFDDNFRNRFCKIDSSGFTSYAPKLGSAFNGAVTKIIVLPDNKLLVGGEFTSYNGTTCNRMVRLNQDLSIDTSFNIGSGFNDSVYDFAMQSDGKIVVVGAFTSVNGYYYNRITRLSYDGSVDSTTFNASTNTTAGKGFDNILYTVAIQSNGKILAAGQITGYFTYDDEPFSSRCVRLNTDGSLDYTYVLNTSKGVLLAFIYKIALFSTGDVILAGSIRVSAFTIIDKSVIKTSSIGNLDTTFNSQSQFNAAARDILMNTDNSFYLVGEFSRNFSNDCRGIAFLNSSGVVERTPQYGGVSGGSVYGICRSYASDVYSITIVGDFTYVDNKFVGGITRLDSFLNFDKNF